MARKQKRRWYANARMRLMMGAAAMILSATAVSMNFAFDTKPLKIRAYKTPNCGSCDGWIEYLQGHGSKTVVTTMDNLGLIKSAGGVPRNLLSSHTAFAGGYTIEGPVPARDIRRLLHEKPTARGLVVPGNPNPPAGKEGVKKAAYDVLIFDAIGGAKVFARH